MVNHDYGKTYTAIDLFSGAGGLSVGLVEAGFSVISAVEKYAPAVNTYRHNHGRTKIICDDIRNVSASDLISFNKSNHVDLIAGCPPCQGFSTLTNKYKRQDPRNELALEMLRIVLQVRPTIVMMENVPGLQNKGKAIFGDFVTQMEKEGYIVNHDVLQVADYGVPQMRRRLVLLAGKGFKIEIPEPTHSRTGGNGKKRWATLREAIGGMKKPMVLKEAAFGGGPRAYNWNVIRGMSELNKRRLRFLSSGENRMCLPDELRPPCHKGKESGFSNVYGRLEWDKPSVTITAGCTTLSKGRFGHPEEERALSVREAARLQTFPDSYDFATDYMDEACTLIGNALPCLFAEIMARQCKKALEDMSK